MKALGLKKMHHTVEKEASPQVMGMVRKVQHLLSVEEVK
jgi:large subunit ribosomal protein L30